MKVQSHQPPDSKHGSDQITLDPLCPACGLAPALGTIAGDHHLVRQTTAVMAKFLFGFK